MQVPKVIQGGEGILLQTGNSQTFIKVFSKETKGQWAFAEFHFAPKTKGPGLHFHKTFSENFYIVSGTLWLCLGSETKVCHPGTLALVTPHTVHDFYVPGPEKCIFLDFMTPGIGFEDFFIKLAEINRQDPGWLSKLQAIRANFDVTDVPGSWLENET